jgi:hypothetical protein
MPMEGAMAQLSRPFQIALLAVVLLGGVWFFALRTHPASTGGSSAPAHSASENPAAPTPVYHGPAPGVEGLTRAIAKAHRAVAQSQQSAKQLEGKSAGPSSAASGKATTGASTAGSQPASSTASKGLPATHPATTHKGSTATSAPSTSQGSTAGRGHVASPSMQATVEGELKQGKLVTILFWNPKASVDVAVRREVEAAGHTLGGKIAVHYARADQVGLFGSITRAVPVFQTPTIVIVNKRGQATTLTGLTDSFSLEQAIEEARHS